MRELATAIRPEIVLHVRTTADCAEELKHDLKRSMARENELLNEKHGNAAS
jgi:hypothetical protein